MHVLCSVIPLSAETTGTDYVAEVPSVPSVPLVSSIATNLGPQVRRATLMRSDVGQDPHGNPVLYTVLMGRPALLTLIDVATTRVLATHLLADTSGAWGVRVSSDNTVYIAAYNKGLLYRYFPRTGEVKNLGPPFKTNDTVLYPMAATPDGKIYGGGYPSGHAYMYDPGTDKFSDLGDMTTNTTRERWIRVAVHDPISDKLYFGIGNQPQLVEYDLATGKKRDLLPAHYSNITAIYDLNYEGGRLFCRKETHNPFENFVLDAETGADVPVTNTDTGETSLTFINGSRGLSPKSPIANKMYFIALDRQLYEYDLDHNTIRSLKVEFPSVATGYGWVKLQDPEWPGWSLVGTVGNYGDVYRYNLETGRHDVRKVELTGQPINIRDIVAGPDGKIYSGGYLAGNLGVFDPATSTVTHLNGSGQTEGLAFLGKKLYMGIYPTARIYEYDTTKPWKPGSVWKPADPVARNPAQIFQLQDAPEISGYTNQDRPFGMAGCEKLGKLFVGTVPKNGMLGGALAVWDARSRAKPEVHWNIIPDQSIVSLVCHGEMVYGGTSIYGGMGVTPRAKEAEFFAWDVEKGKVAFTLVPAPGQPAITQLTVGPDENIWGLAGGVIFAFDPGTKKVIHSSEEFPGVRGTLHDGSLITGRDGTLYGAAGGRLFRINPATRELTVIASGADQVAQDTEGRLYIVGNPPTDLYQLTLPPVSSSE